MTAPRPVHRETRGSVMFALVLGWQDGRLGSTSGEYRRTPGVGGGADPKEPAGGIFTVLQDELGLRLESIRGPLE